MTAHDCGFELGCEDESCPNRPENRTPDLADHKVLKAVAEALGWQWESVPAELVPSSEDCVQGVLQDLRSLGYEVVPLDHPDCVQAVRHVAETHHGPDYPHCTCGADNYEHSFSCDPVAPRQGWDHVNERPTMVMTYRLFEDDHGLRCPRCQRVVLRGQPYEPLMTGVYDDGAPVSELVCVYCVGEPAKRSSVQDETQPKAEPR